MTSNNHCSTPPKPPTSAEATTDRSKPSSSPPLVSNHRHQRTPSPEASPTRSDLAVDSASSPKSPKPRRQLHFISRPCRCRLQPSTITSKRTTYLVFDRRPPTPVQSLPFSSSSSPHHRRYNAAVGALSPPPLGLGTIVVIGLKRKGERVVGTRIQFIIGFKLSNPRRTRPGRS